MTVVEQEFPAPGNEFLTAPPQALVLPCAEDETDGNSAFSEGAEYIEGIKYSSGFRPLSPGLEVLERLYEWDSEKHRGVLEHLKTMLNSAKMPESWKRENIDFPTNDCRFYAFELLKRIFIQYNILPFKVALSKEGGIFASYRSAENENTLRVEIDNELDAVAVVSDGVHILESGILEDDDLEESIVDAFKATAPLAIGM